MIHELKTEKVYFDRVLNGEKTFEVRKNDRNFSVGDILALNEIENGEYTGRSCLVYTDYILNNADFCKEGYVIMNIKPCTVCKTTATNNPIRRIR